MGTQRAPATGDGVSIEALAAPSPSSSSDRGRIDSLVLLALLLIAWQILFQIVGDVAMSSPMRTLDKMVSMLRDASFWPNVWKTMAPFLIALVLEIAIGVVAGALLGIHRLSGDAFGPLLVGIYSIPKVLFYPVIILTFGIATTSEVVFAFIHGVFPIILFTMNAVRSLKPVYAKTARSLRLSLVQRVWHVAIPAVLPEIFSGFRIAFAMSLLGVLLCEMFGSKNGLGFLLVGAIGANRVDETMALAVMIAAFAVFTNFGLLWVDHKLHQRF